MKYIFWTVLIRMTGTLKTVESFTLKQIILISIPLTGRLQMEYTNICRGVRRFADVNYLDIRDDLEVARVDGGYIMSIGFSDPESGDTLFGVCKGKNYINLMENSKCVASIPCKIKKYETEYKKAVKEIV